MADREALRDFQRRLAERLQAAPADGVQVAWLAAEAMGGRYLISLAQAGEIFPAATVQAVPHTQPWFLGVVSLRGGLYGVADLGGLIAANGDGLSRTPASGADSQFITFNPAFDVQCALRIDRLAGLRSAGDFAGMGPPPEGAPEWFGSILREASGVCWQELNLQALSHQPRFLRISI